MLKERTENQWNHFADGRLKRDINVAGTRERRNVKVNLWKTGSRTINAVKLHNAICIRFSWNDGLITRPIKITWIKIHVFFKVMNKFHLVPLFTFKIQSIFPLSFLEFTQYGLRISATSVCSRCVLQTWRDWLSGGYVIGALFEVIKSRERPLLSHEFSSRTERPKLIHRCADYT